jgi:hypothetical protein
MTWMIHNRRPLVAQQLRWLGRAEYRDFSFVECFVFLANDIDF